MNPAAPMGPYVPPGFAPATTNAIIAALLARSDGASFQVGAVNVPVGTGQVPSPTVPPSVAQAFAPQALGKEPVLVSWSCTYRNTKLSGSLVCDAGSQGPATGVLVALAQVTFDLQDLRMATLGSPTPIKGNPDNAPAWPYSGG